jgi:deoxyribonucleoside regulator
METNRQKQEMIARASVLYYEYQKSQNTIARELGISRSYVSQLLTQAKDEGLVKISVNVNNDFKREIAFTNRFPGLRFAYIMNSDSEAYTAGNIGRFAAPHITRLINNSAIIGINLGKAVQRVISHLDRDDFSGSSSRFVIQMMGGYNSNKTINATLPNEVVFSLGRILNCKCLYLNCPAIFKDRHVRNLMLKEQAIKQVTEYWNKIDLAIMGIGAVNETSKVFPILSQEMKDNLHRSKACCDITINFFDRNGNYLEVLTDNKISIPLRQLKKIKTKVVICSGTHKARALIAGLRAEMIDVLIIDSIIADAVEKLLDGALKK